MDALKSLYDSQVSEDEAVEVLQCSQQYDEPIDLDEGAFRVVNVAPIDHEAPRCIQDIVPGKLPNLLAVDLLNAFNEFNTQAATEIWFMFAQAPLQFPATGLRLDLKDFQAAGIQIERFIRCATIQLHRS